MPQLTSQCNQDTLLHLAPIVCTSKNLKANTSNSLFRFSGFLKQLALSTSC